eukprot:sb/3465927/
MAEVLEFEPGFQTLSLRDTDLKAEKKLKKKSKQSSKRRSRKVDYLDTEIASDKLVEDITCKGCRKKFSSGRVPKILHCLHAMCTECINVSFLFNEGKNKVKCASCGVLSAGRNAESFRTQSMAEVLEFEPGFQTLSLRDTDLKAEKKLKKKSKQSSKRRSRKVDYLDTEIASDKLVEDITCKGCRKKFSSGRVPKILHCLHAMCTECINVSFLFNEGKNKVKCASCGVLSAGRNAESFRTQSYVQILADIASCYEGHLSGTLHCIGCAVLQADTKCPTNNQYHQKGGELSHTPRQDHGVFLLHLPSSCMYSVCSDPTQGLLDTSRPVTLLTGFCLQTKSKTSVQQETVQLEEGWFGTRCHSEEC